ncbi:MAG: hypothetical protein B6I31_03865 [Desulfobacteraceae bacterium 4572_19]|nr:MAG: hypothetical protein B6I31_03865 [Desulfobacteraceae bacterium 4572_19]
MSNITGITDKTHIYNNSTTGAADKDAFRLALENTLENNSEQAGTIGNPKSLGEIQAPAINMVQFNAGNTVSDMTYKANNLLELLDSYSKDLDNPNKSLRDIEPLISIIKENAEHLLADANGTIIGDEAGIKELAGQCAVAANVEYIKFQRGDYV